MRENPESMTRERFAAACLATLKLLMAHPQVGASLMPKRCPGYESAPEHLSWMLAEAITFYADGKVQKANRWLGYVQGSMHADAYASVEDLKRANMPEGEKFDAEKT